jgi:hypothetical protein
MNITKENEHQIIFVGEVMARNDPKMLGRVRAKPLYSENFNDIIESIESTYLRSDRKDLKQEYWWTEKDKFVFLPLLPFYISQVPEKDEYVHLIYQNKKFLFDNQFYIQGPFSSPMNSKFEYQKSSESILASGDRYKLGINLKNNDGSPMEGSTKGIFPDPGDNALLGRGSADVIVKSEEVLIRAGKTKTSDLNPNNFPKALNNRGFLQISNFLSTQVEGPNQTKFSMRKVVQKIKKIIIWNITDLGNTANVFNGSINLYKMLDGTTATTENLKLESAEKLSVGTDYGALLESIPIVNKTFDETIFIFNQFIDSLFEGSNKIQNYQINSDLNFSGPNRFPFVVIPSKITYQTAFRFRSPNNDNEIIEQNNFAKFFDNIKVKNSDYDKGFFIVSANNDNLPTFNSLSKPISQDVTVTDVLDSPITYSIMGGQRIYLLSHDSQGPKGRIDIPETIYGIQQNDFVKDGGIYDKSYPTVRGDELIVVLRKIFEFVKGHVHPIATVAPIPVSSGNGQTTLEIDQLLANAENTILNQQIRIN